ncbi:carbohydrate ABC transporter permease [Pseudonocardia sichuanensis]|uniref:Carbohydrate ABC transporter membrane protein 1 (CUT1 family) n=1 Tax=Pseudonocardia kunmingensis TaxID=630975 RepID=A0A543DA40_9PSEU|nr:sugar ABC transporter permease [Pseudonocardia kunmingensis]TQM06209.1 carbohydrate ABC transporter membrane protein 1 (CUT1 family) [Pseudonocardia kunmingensis]
MTVLTPAAEVERPAHTPATAAARRDPRSVLAIALFLAPAVALVAVLMIVPFLDTAYRSFFDDNGFTRTFVGLENYATLFTSAGFGQTLLNTLMWVAGTLALPVLIGLLIAVGTHEVRWGALARFSLVLPYALSGAATAVVWMFVLRDDGALNSALAALGLADMEQGWLLEWPLNTIVMIVASTWQGTGVAVILFLIGLQAIPPSTIEAAKLDGATGFRLFWHITLPQLRPITVVVVGISVVNSLKTFDIVWLLTQGGPGTASETLALTMYRETFTLARYGSGAAVAVVLTVVVVAVSWIYLRRQLRAN